MSVAFDTELYLTRKEAAEYKGLAGESSLRDAESRGLASITDAQGRTLYSRRALDAWDVKGKEPTEAKKKRVLVAAQKVRAQEARENVRRMAAEEQQVLAEEGAWLTSLAASNRAEDELRRSLKVKNAERARVFRADVMNEYEIRELLSIDGARFRMLVRTTVIREVQPPPEAKVRFTYGEPIREYDGPPMLVVGGPFYSRADALAQYRGPETPGSEPPSGAPPGPATGIGGTYSGTFAAGGAATTLDEVLAMGFDKALAEFLRKSRDR